MQDLIIEIQQLRSTLNLAVNKLKERGQGKAEAEKAYRIALATEILKHRDNKVPVTIINDICRGDKDIAELKFKRDVAETLYKTAEEKINATKLEIRIVENQLNAIRKGE
ncbi:hypothetical protein [Senegalia massiliensis]|uniref:hypothetical protein n=1 Tax=Senegalia massiliensis TaxID=1720316 RepID=UPI001032063B|nr:hypothetical protein [Senegalia massiliensis]